MASSTLASVLSLPATRCVPHTLERILSKPFSSTDRTHPLYRGSLQLFGKRASCLDQILVLYKLFAGNEGPGAKETTPEILTNSIRWGAGCCRKTATQPQEGSLPGTIETPAFFMVLRATALSPILRIASGDGPMKVMLHDWQISTKWAFSDRNP